MTKRLRDSIGRMTVIVVLGAALLAPQSTIAYTSYTSLLYSYLSAYSIRYSFRLVYSLPARDLNGIALNGAALDERYIEGISLDDVVLGNGKATSLDLKGTRLKHLNQLDGALLTATLDNGETLPVRIDSVEPKEERADPDVIHYYASYEAEEGWQPLCGVDEAGEPIGAIPLLGRWDYTQGTETGGSKIDDDSSFTFACDGYALHKCVDAGYKPWLDVVVCQAPNACETVSLASYHQACTRMLRADFCGDGTSYTNDGVLVSMYDGLGIRYDSETWDIEAEWDEDGAVCARQDRLDDLRPSCMDYLADETCGDPTHFQDGILLISELPRE